MAPTTSKHFQHFQRPGPIFITSSFRPPNSSFPRKRNPEGKGGANHTQTLPTTRPHFHNLVCRRQLAWTIRTKMVLRGLKVCLNATGPRFVIPAPQFVIPAKAGIQGWCMGCK